MRLLTSVLVIPVLLVVSQVLAFSEIPPPESLVTVHTSPAAPGGNLIVAQRSEPKTLNPLVALDAPSREVIARMNADLIAINRLTQKPEAALAESWNVSSDGRHYLIRLRKGLHFSDGSPFDSDDVLFSMRVYLDENVHAPQHDLLILNGHPLEVHKVDPYVVAFDLPQSYAAAERLFDNLPMLPRHLLEKPYQEGRLASSWGLNVKPEEIAGMGPFRFARYEAGQAITLEKNPFYWKKDGRQQRLPYLDDMTFVFAGSEDGQVARFISGDADIVSRLGPNAFRMLQQRAADQRLDDLGPGLEYTFLALNFADPLFLPLEFRRALTAAIDRESIVRIAYSGRATAIAANVSPANKLWFNSSLHPPQYSPDEAKKILHAAGYRWNPDGKLMDRDGKPVRFTIVTAANNSERLQTATLIQDDLSRIGMEVQVVPLEFRALVDRVTRTRQFEACMLSFGGADGDPDSEMNVWLSSGPMHVWNPNQKQAATAWEHEIDELMQQQMTTLDYGQRKSLYDRVQKIVAEQLPIISLVSPHVLVASRRRVINFQPAVFESYALWNADVLALQKRSGSPQ